MPEILLNTGDYVMVAGYKVFRFLPTKQEIELMDGAAFIITNHEDHCEEKAFIIGTNDTESGAGYIVYDLRMLADIESEVLAQAGNYTSLKVWLSSQGLNC